MAYWNRIGAGTLVAALLGSTAVRADVTAEQVWADWVAYYQEMGQTVTTTSQGMQGDTLVIEGAKFASTAPEATAQIDIAEVRLRNVGDGSVEVTLSETIPVTMTAKPAEGEATDMTIDIRQTGMKLMVSGAPGDMTYDFAAPTLAVGIADMKVNGEAVPMSVGVNLKNSTGKARMVSGSGREVTSDFTSESMDFDISAKDPAGTGSFATKGTLNALSSTSDMKIPQDVNMADMNAALKAGVVLNGSLTYGAGNYTMDFQDGEQTMNMVSSADGGSLSFGMSSAGLAYGGGGKNTRIAMTGNQLPAPMDLTIAEAAFDFAMPVMAADTPQPFKLMVKIADLTLSDSVWSLFDPTSQLPRDPATVLIDASGTATPKIDIFDPVQAAAAPVPAMVESVNLNALQLKMAGADLTGSGAATFDNMGPAPKPVGSVDLKLVGGNALIDKLVAMGLVPEDQAMGARMMLGLFAVPAGDDVLTSTIEFREDGGVYANGQRIQ